MKQEIATQISKTKYDLALIAARRKQPNLSQVADLLESSHNEGDQRATYAIATWYLYGHAGYKKSLSKAIKLLKIAVESDHALAHFDLAVCYETGEGVKQNYKKAYLHYLAAALNGDLDSIGEVGRCLFYGIGTAQDRNAAEVWFRRADSMKLEIR